MQSIKEEFEKAFEKKFGITRSYYEMLESALWAAKWMAEKCANLFDPNEWMAKEIRQLAKELDETP